MFVSIQIVPIQFVYSIKKENTRGMLVYEQQQVERKLARIYTCTGVMDADGEDIEIRVHLLAVTWSCYWR